MHNSTKTVLSAVTDLLIIVFTFFAIRVFWVSRGDGNMAVAGARSLIYFTNLSNLLAAASAVPTLFFTLKNRTTVLPLWAYILKFSAASAVAVTFLTTALFLAPSFAMRGGNYFLYFAGNTFFLHFLTPVLTVISAVLLQDAEGFTGRLALWGFVPVLLYGAVYIYEVAVVGTANGGWNDFYGFTFGGNMKLAAVSLAVMYSASAGISLALYALHRAVYGKQA